MDGNADQVVDYKPFVDKRKPSSMMAVKVNLHNGVHTLIPVTVKMILSAVQDCKRFVLKDGRPLHMVKLVGAVRNFCVHDKHLQIDLEDEVTHHFLEVAYSYEKRLESVEDEMIKSVLFV
jgi:hypothetical protein